jgi:hypothetical protein
MRVSRPTARLAAAFMAATSLLIGGSVVAVPASATAHAPSAIASTTLKDALLGTWVGTFDGYYQGGYAKGDERFIVTAVRGANAKGTWQYRMSSSDSWSAKEPLQWIAVKESDGAWRITGVDQSGTYSGLLSPDGKHMDLSYVSPGTAALMSYRFLMHKK